VKRIKISQIGQFAKGKYERLIEVAVAETYKSLVQKSPVLTGRFKASWAVGQNDESYVGQPPGKSFYPPPNPETPNKIGYNKEKAGNIHSVYNNLPYGEKLETAPVGQGGSKKTNGPGWIRATGKRIQRLMPTLAKQVEVE
tara:strand:- start:80 stop:502 length:423 start_codon:yes stop_codon:yes gene_type:complete